MAIQTQIRQRSSTKRFNKAAFITAVRQTCRDATKHHKQRAVDANKERTESLVGEHDREHVGATAVQHDYQSAAREEMAAKTKNLETFLGQEHDPRLNYGKVVIAEYKGKKRALILYPGRDEGYGLISAVGIQDRLDELAREFGFAEFQFCSDESGVGKALYEAQVGKQVTFVGKVLSIH